MSSSDATLQACRGILAVLGVAEAQVNSLAVSGLSFAAQVRVRQAAGKAAPMPLDLLGRSHLVDRMAVLAATGLTVALHPTRDESTDEVLAAALTAQEAPQERAAQPLSVEESPLVAESKDGPMLGLPVSATPGPTTDEVDNLVSFDLDEPPVSEEAEDTARTSTPPAPAVEQDAIEALEELEPVDDEEITLAMRRPAEQPWEMDQTMPDGLPFSLDDALVSFDDGDTGQTDDFDPAEAAAALVSIEDLEELDAGDVGDEADDLASEEPELIDLDDDGPTMRRRREITTAASAESDGEIDLFGAASGLVSFDDVDEQEDEQEVEDVTVVDDLSALQDLIGFDQDVPTLEAVEDGEYDDLEAEEAGAMASPAQALAGVPMAFDDDDLDEVEVYEDLELEEFEELSVEAFEDNEDDIEWVEDMTDEMDATEIMSIGAQAPTETPAATVATAAVASVATAKVAAVVASDDVAIIRDHSESRPRAAAAAIQLGPGGTGTVLGLEEEEEPIELAAADEDDDYDYDDDDDEMGGFQLEVEEEEYDDEDEEEAPQLTDDVEDMEDHQVHSAEADITEAELEAIRAKAIEASQSSLSDAVTYWSDLLDLSPEDMPAHVARGRLYLDLSDYSRAMSDFQRAESLDPQSPEPLVAIGDLFFNRKDYARAIDYFNQALRTAPEHAMAYCRRGISHYYRKNYVDALDDLEKAEALNSEIQNIGTYVDMARKKAKRRR